MHTKTAMLFTPRYGRGSVILVFIRQIAARNCLVNPKHEPIALP